MAIEETTDDQISELICVRKTVVVGSASFANKVSHTQVNVEANSDDGRRFSIYTRQLTKIADDFSCGLLWHLPSGDKLTLLRYNGASHLHVNKIESTDTAYSCHIHRATERYLRVHRKPEGFAEATDRYTDLEGAVRCLANDCNLVGLLQALPQRDLFENGS